MSTRANIAIIEADGTKYPVQIYLHSDGYPQGRNGVMAWLCAFARLFSSAQGDDAEYCAAQLLRHQAVGQYLRETKRNPEREGAAEVLGFLSWGLCTRPHGDEDYFYEVTPATGRVVCKSRGGTIVAEQPAGETWEDRSA